MRLALVVALLLLAAGFRVMRTADVLGAVREVAPGFDVAAGRGSPTCQIELMPEGDTILSAARRVGEALVGKPIVAIETPQPRHALDRWPERLGGPGGARAWTRAASTCSSASRAT